MIFSMPHSSQKSKKTPLFRWILNYTLLVLLLISFYTQHVLAYSLYERDNYETSVVFQFNSSRPQHNLFFKEEFPQQEICSAVELELEEDEDVSHSSESLHANSLPKPVSFEHFYQSLIWAKYIQLLSSFNQQPVDPLFILHHSWKDNISSLV